MSDLPSDLKAITAVFGDTPTVMIRNFEQEIPHIQSYDVTLTGYLKKFSISADTLQSALNLKKNLGQLHVIIHALGILLSLPYVIQTGETIESVSLGAGNTGKQFDLITDRRVAEFKFIHWRGGAEAIRQNNIFKTFLNLLWDTSGKRKQLFLTGTEEAISFLHGGRDLSSVLSKDRTTRDKFESRYAGRYQTVREFYRENEGQIELLDLKKIIPLFTKSEIAED